MYTRKAAKKILFFIFFFIMKKSVVWLVERVEQYLAQAESIWNAIGEQDRPIRKAL